MIPVVAIVGRPNVGKSTLFNCLTKGRDALVADQPGLTRDRQYGHAQYEGKHFIVVDTGGIGLESAPIDDLVTKQVEFAIKEADIILFLVDARGGLTPLDEEVASKLRQFNKSIFLVLNKVDGVNVDLVLGDFYRLGFSTVMPIAAAHRHGISALIEAFMKPFPEFQPAEMDKGIQLAIVGRPNVGKSTLVNRMLGEERVIVCDQPGTTRDSIFIPFERQGIHYTLIDTAGVRRRGNIADKIEKFSVLKTLQSIEIANVVLYMIDAREGIAEQDLKLLGFILNAGKSLIIAVNKWDGLTPYQKERVKKELDRRLVFVSYAQCYFISALHGTGVGSLFPQIETIYQSAMKEFSTSELTRLLEMAIEGHQPPLVKGRRIKLRFAHPGGHNPPQIVIHGNQVGSLPLSYKRYLENYFRKALKLMGTPIRLKFKSSSNPYQP